MATTSRDQRIVTVDVTQAELISLLAQKAQQAGLIDFDPDNIQVQEIVAGAEYQIIFSKENV